MTVLLVLARGAAPADTANANKLVFVGSGYVEDNARQVVRTPGGVVYIFAADDRPQRTGTGPGVARAWRADTAGIPTSFSEVDGAHRPTSAGTATNVIVDVDARLDRSGIVHLVYVDEATATLFYRTFSTLTDTWGTPTTLATGVNVPDGYFKNLKRSRGAASIVLDANDVPHVAYIAGGAIYYRNRAGGSWSAPQTVSSGGFPLHTQLAFGGDGTLHLSWLDDNQTSASIRYARMPAGGAWQPPEVVSSSDVQADDTGDQGPSIAVTSNGTPYVLWITQRLADAVRIKYRSGSGWVYDQLPADLYTHAPQIFVQGNDVYAVLGHDNQIRFGYEVHPAGKAWSPYTAMTSTTDGTLDGSASVRWDPQRETDPTVIDAAFFDEDESDTGTYLPRLYYMALLPAGTPPAPGDTTPPTVAVTAPAAGATVSGTTAVAADASDDTGVAGVRFLVDGVQLGPEDTTSPYVTSWDTATAASGSHTVTAVARDAAGNSATSAVTVTIAGGSPPPAPSGLVAAYSFDAGTLATDASGNGNNGTISGATQSSSGRYGGALQFNGVSSFVTVPEAASLDLSTGITLEAWVDPSVLGTSWRTVLMKEQPGGMVYSLYANQSSSVPVAQLNIGGERSATGTATLPLNTWTHLAATFEGANLRLYVNGTLVRTLAQAGSIPASTGALRIGGNGVWPEWFAGLIDDVRVYNRALSAGEIAADMATPVGSSPPPPPPPGDTTPPTVALTAPAAGATVSGTTSVTASASDDVGVAGVQFRLDGASLGLEDTSAPYAATWDTTTAANGAHTLTAVARDAAGNTAATGAVGVTVSNAAPPASGLVAAYSFNAGTGTTAADSSGRGNAGTISGATWVAGKYGKALSFNGSSSLVTIPDSASLDLTSGMTLEAWVDASTLGTSWRTVVFKERTGGMEYALYANQSSGVPVGQAYVGGERSATGTASVGAGAWKHLALTYDGASVRLYVDGALVRTVAQTGAMTPSTGPLRIGGNGIWPEWFAGSIDEVRVYNRALSAAEIASDMGAPLP